MVNKNIKTSKLDAAKRQLDKLKDSSAFCRLSLNNEKIDWAECCRTKKFPFAFFLHEGDVLDKIDEVLSMFDIENSGSNDFKARFKDPIIENRVGDIKKYNAIQSLICELLVAEYFQKEKGEEIIGLQAWGNGCLSDIKSKDNKANITYYTEVKYLGPIPEQYEAVKNGVNPSIEMPTLQNYLHMRIVDAIRQLKEKSINGCDKKRVFMLLESSITSDDNILKAFQNGWGVTTYSWDDKYLSHLCKGFSTEGKVLEEKFYKEKSMLAWLGEIDSLIIAYLDQAYNINIKVIWPEKK